jgi:hypothetical protein
MKDWRYNIAYSQPWHLTQVTFQFHDPVCFVPGNSTTGGSMGPTAGLGVLGKNFLPEKFLASSGVLTMIPWSFNPLRSNCTDRATPDTVARYLSVILDLCICGCCLFPSPRNTGSVTRRDIKLKCQLLELMIPGTQCYSPTTNWMCQWNSSITARQ